MAETNEQMQNEINDEDADQLVGTNFETTNHVQARGKSNVLTISGQYRPGDYTRDIHTDNLVENWTLVNTNPALAERLHFRIRGVNNNLNPPLGDTNNWGTNLRYHVQVRVEYLVEFKELRDGLKYPVSSQPLLLTIDQSTRN